MQPLTTDSQGQGEGNANHADQTLSPSLALAPPHPLRALLPTTNVHVCSKMHRHEGAQYERALSVVRLAVEGQSY